MAREKIILKKNKSKTIYDKKHNPKEKYVKIHD